MIRRENSNGQSQVEVSGDFNDWTPGQLLLVKRGKECSTTIPLEVGRRYAFRYVTSGGDWFDDEEADDYELNEFGGTNSIIDLRQSVDA